MAKLTLPQAQLSQINVPKKPQIPLEQILAVEGQSPVAGGIDALSAVLAKRNLAREQGAQIVQLAQMTGQTPPVDNSLDPATYERGLALKQAHEAAVLNAENKNQSKKHPLGNPFKGKDGKDYQYFYDEKNDEVSTRELTQGAPPPKSTGGGDGTLVQSGLFDENGQPIMINNKSGKSQTITLPNGTVGHTQTKIQLTPTSQTRSSGEFASTVIPHIADLKDQITKADAAGFIGPLGGRYQDFMTRKIGSTGNKDADYMLGRMRTTRDLLGSATMKAHVGNRGGGELLQHFLSDIDTGKQSAAVLQGELDGLVPYMQGYVDAGKGLKTISPREPMAIPALTGKKKSLADKLGL